MAPDDMSCLAAAGKVEGTNERSSQLINVVGKLTYGSNYPVFRQQLDQWRSEELIG